MVLEKLGSSLRGALDKVRNSLTVDRELVGNIVKEIQKSLLGADVNVKLVLDLTKKIRSRAISEDNKALDKREHLITIIYEELSAFLGDGEEFELQPKQNRILLVGLYGQGKTTTCAKLGVYFKKRSSKVALISTDTWRPAAYEQLKQLGENANVDVYGDPSIKDPIKIYKKFEKDFSKYDIVIIDSAGRDSLNEELVDEISDLNSFVKPTDTFMVLGADVGQTAQKQTQAFKENLDITGVIITKMDGTGKGGGALCACSACSAPVRFIGVGEKITDLERFNSSRFVSQLLGMGDIKSLLEKAKLAIDEESAKDMGEKMMSGEFDLNDLYEQLKAMKKMGSMSKLLNMIPGVSGLGIDKSSLNVQEEKLQKWKFIMNSMTPHEKKNPYEIDISRIKRIAKGSGSSITNVRDLLKHFKQTKKMMGMFKDPNAIGNIDEKTMGDPKEMMKMMKKFGGNKAVKQMVKQQKKMR